MNLVDGETDHEVGEEDGDEDDEHGEEEDGEAGVGHVEAGRDPRVGDPAPENVTKVDLADHHDHGLERREGRVREDLLSKNVTWLVKACLSGPTVKLCRAFFACSTSLRIDSAAKLETEVSKR